MQVDIYSVLLLFFLKLTCLFLMFQSVVTVDSLYGFFDTYTTLGGFLNAQLLLGNRESQGGDF